MTFNGRSKLILEKKYKENLLKSGLSTKVVLDIYLHQKRMKKQSKKLNDHIDQIWERIQVLLSIEI